MAYHMRKEEVLRKDDKVLNQGITENVFMEK
jgi:hypothetical protein